MKSQPSFPAILVLLFLCSCAKDPAPSFLVPSFPDHSITQCKNYVPGNVQMLPASDSTGLEGACDDIPAGANQIVIRYALDDGNISAPLCFAETELKDILVNAGFLPGEAAAFLANIFHNDKLADPEKAHELGTYVAAWYPLPSNYLPDCFSIYAIGRSGYPGDSYPGSTCHSGNIDLFSVRQSKANPDGYFILEPGFSGIRLFRKSTGEVKEIVIASISDFADLLMISGFNPTEADAVVQKILWGKYSVRQVWDLYQFYITPNLPFVQALTNAEADDWELMHAGIGIYEANNGIASLYFAKGRADLRCNFFVIEQNSDAHQAAY